MRIICLQVFIHRNARTGTEAGGFGQAQCIGAGFYLYSLRVLPALVSADYFNASLGQYLCQQLSGSCIYMLLQ